MITKEDYNEALTRNFRLHEFLFSDFFSPRQQKMVIESYESESLEVRHNLVKLARNLQVLRDHLGCAVSVNIGYRPLWWEKKQGRSGKSRHVKMMAADIIAEDYAPSAVQDAIEQLIEEGKMDEGGLGRYHTFTHYDIHFVGHPRRWDFT